ncbi:hypothetical protein LOTGIDRAFT_169930 [Lottia gigantea]|uniref:Ig-like domain-containing protein n=1 Tax=Lottia gigantea TaxID=225164 RepID=V3ZJC1_LOTGI|nr:hypothetical protein LOTGIDRAFT_169930 [Lottia gigantea]ESO82460.1 hypothetical protein LOTGIDRAFT_169930 [Lottia gigantea]
MALIEICFFYLFCVSSISTNTDYDGDVQNYDSYNEGFNTDVCNSPITPFSTPDKRLASYVLGENETPISDLGLSYDWYGQPNYKMYSGNNPGTDRCGTVQQVYFEDDSEASQSTNITQLWACVNYNNSCNYRIPISVTFCEQLNHHVYRIDPAIPQNASFCLERFNSPLNYITDVEVIIPPPVEVAGQMKYQFRCMFDLSTSDNYWYHVTWYRDGQIIKNVPPISHSNNPVGGSVLDETMFGGGLGFEVQCAYAVSLQADSETGYVKKSTERYVGIELLTPTVNIADGSKSEIKVRPTIPIGCPNSNPECSLSVNIIEPPSSTSSCDPESSFSDCGISISSRNWDQEHSVKLSVNAATQYGAKSAINTITLKTSSSFPSHSIWQDYIIGTVRIRTSQDTTATQGRHCSAVCDPHMRTFGGL